MYPDVDRPSDKPVPTTHQAAVCITVLTPTHIGIAELVLEMDAPPRWCCEVWDRDSAEDLVHAKFYNEAAARAWLVAMCGKEA